MEKKQTPMQELFNTHLQGFSKEVIDYYLQQEKNELEESYEQALHDTNFNDLVGDKQCEVDAEKHFIKTYKWKAQ